MMAIYLFYLKKKHQINLILSKECKEKIFHQNSATASAISSNSQPNISFSAVLCKLVNVFKKI
mgnify:CR=1 FL=1